MEFLFREGQAANAEARGKRDVVDHPLLVFGIALQSTLE